MPHQHVAGNGDGVGTDQEPAELEAWIADCCGGDVTELTRGIA